MIGSAGISWRLALTALLPAFALSACSGGDDALNEKVAAAEAAAAKAEAAQQAAEKAAAALASAPQAAPAPEPTVMADTPRSFDDDGDGGNGDGGDGGDSPQGGSELSMGGDEQSGASDGGIVVPGVGA